MNYEQEYQYFYTKYYSKSEKLIKQFLITEKSKKRNATLVYNELEKYLLDKTVAILGVGKYPSIVSLLLLFNNRHKYYEADEINSIFANEIKTDFERIDLLELLPPHYTLRKLLKEIAVLNAINEINGLLRLNRDLFNRFYLLDDFTGFEIKEYKGFSIEDTDIYKSLNERLHPDYYTNIIYENFDFDESEKVNDKGYSLPIAIALLNEIGFFELEKIKKLSPTSLARVIAIIQQKDPNNKNGNRAISGNIRVLNPDNKEDGFKYTSHKHAEKAKALLNEIKQGSQ